MDYGVIVLKQNSEEIRRKIREANISVCPCAEFVDACWLDCHPNLYTFTDVHGLGYPYEGETRESTLAIFEHEARNPYYCKDVDEFIEMIKQCK